MKLADVKYSQILENTESKSFKDLAEKLQGTVSFDMPPFFPLFLLLCHLLGLLWPASCRAPVPSVSDERLRSLAFLEMQSKNAPLSGWKCCLKPGELHKELGVMSSREVSVCVDSGAFTYYTRKEHKQTKEPIWNSYIAMLSAADVHTFVRSHSNCSKFFI